MRLGAKINEFMRGKRGPDQLSLAMVCLSAVVSLAASVLGLIWRPLRLIRLISGVLLILALVRIFSTNLEARYRENEKFLRVWNSAASWFKQRRTMMKDAKTHRHFRCPTCRAMLRVPKGRGKINIRCPKCGQSFIKKT